jgi:hypothetical protein
MKRTRIIVLALAVALAACATAQQNTLASVEYACASATAALKTVIVLNDKLSAGTRASVTKAVAIVNPICSQPNIPTLDSTARTALDGALSQLTLAAAEATK